MSSIGPYLQPTRDHKQGSGQKELCNLRVITAVSLGLAFSVDWLRERQGSGGDGLGAFPRVERRSFATIRLFWSMTRVQATGE